MYPKSNSTFAEVKTSLNKVYDRIRIPQTKEKGQELFKTIISKNISNKTLLCSVISNIQEKISKLPCLEKPPYLSLLSLFFFNQSQSESLKLYYPYLSPILSILQSLIIDSNSEIFSQISDTFAEIVQYLMPNDISASDKDLDPEEKESYETLQSFCILNIKIEQKLNRVIGSLCLTKLVENCPFVLKNQYMKYILENIIENVSKENFNAKYELLNCLISLILGAESLFCPFANMTLYKILDFLTDKDWLKRKLALNVIYTMIFYCKDEILPLKEHIINFLNVLKNDKIKEVRDVSILILQMFDDNKSIQSISSGVNISNSGIEIKESGKKKRINNNNNSLKRVRVVKKPSNTNNYNKKKKVSNNKIISTSPSNVTNKNRKNNLITNLSKRNNNINNKNNNNRDIKTSSRILKKENSTSTNDKNDKKLSVNKRNNSFGKRKPIEVKKNSSISNTLNKDRERDKEKENDRGRIRGESSRRTYRTRERRESSSRKFGIKRKTPMTRSVNLSKEGSIRSEFGLRYPKYVNRKKDLSFVNQKMVIKPDPSKSIFNSNMNMAFFNQDKNLNGDVIVIPNENRSNYNTYNNFYKPKFEKDEKEEKNKNENEKKSKKDIKRNFRENIDKDFDNNLNNINELITLDAKIKTNNIKDIDNLIQDKNSFNKKEEISNDISVENHIENIENNNTNIISNDQIVNNTNINNNKINNDKNNANLINLLLTEVRALSNKQITLLDLMDEIQTNTQEQIENLNKKIVDLDSTVKDLNHQLYVLQRDQSY